MMPLLIAILVGLAAVLAVLGLREPIVHRFHTDAAWVRQTALRFTPNPVPAEMWVAVAYAIAIGMLMLLLWAINTPLVAIGLWLVLLLIPRLVIEAAWKRRRKQIDMQLPAAITAMCNSLRAGLTLVQALQRLAEQAPEPIRTDFRVMANRYAYGADLETTILEAKQRLSLPNFNLFASALLLNREMGGDVSETLSRISQSLEKLRQMRQTVEAHTAEGRTNIKVLLIAPVVMLLMMATVDGEGVRMMFTTPQGYLILFVAAVLTIAGVYFASKITQTEI